MVGRKKDIVARKPGGPETAGRETLAFLPAVGELAGDVEIDYADQAAGL